VILVGDGDVAANARLLAEVLVRELGKPLVVQGRELFLGTSIGVTLFPDDAADATTLLKNGDIAMYQAKMAGKNCYRYYSRAMDHAVERRVHMEQELRGAWSAASCAWPTSRSSACATAAWSASKCCCAGSIRPWVRFRRRCSSKWPSRAG
jgi:hypothetical protein